MRRAKTCKTLTVTLRLNRTILGWMLVPSYRHPSPQDVAYSWLSELYGEDYEQMAASEIAFMSGEPIEKVQAHIRDVCSWLKMSVSFCGGGRTVRLWREQALKGLSALWDSITESRGAT